MTNETLQTSTSHQVLSVGMRWQEAGNRDALAESLADALLLQLDQALQSDGRASLVVSGGSTPAPVFKALSVADINWSAVSVTLADERWVPPGHADSNESLVRDTLLVDKAASAQFVSLYRPEVAPEDALAAIEADLNTMPWPISALILGMGNDGHTASLFPDAPAQELAAAMALDNPSLVALMHPPSVSQVRITLTRAALLSSAHRYLHITGEDKLGVLSKALEQVQGGDDAPVGTYQPGMAPVIGLLSEKPASTSVFWSP